jgi:chromosome condensin MukBEF MukE localization factor
MNYLDKQFVDVDVVLRRGGHINRSNLVAYDWLCNNHDDLKSFYGNYGTVLMQHPDGFFFLTVSGGKLRSRLLPKTCIHLGMFIALKARDPEITRSSGWMQTTQLLHDIETTVPKDVLQQVYAPGRKENVVDDRIALAIGAAIKVLNNLCFIEVRGDKFRPLEAITRFAEFARHNNEPDENAKIKMTIERGVVFHDAAADEEYEEDNHDIEETQN